ncbi:MAG: PD-(D/E)XK nuclease family protein [Flavobacteriia bacterium]
MKFTDQIALYIKENKLNPRNLTIVLPSERAKKYIASSMFTLEGKPLLAPEMVTIDKWVRSFSDRTVIDRTRTLIRLFKIQLANPTDPKDVSFDEFMAWGNILLSDFDEIDRYKLDSKDVFKNLASIKEIESWSFAQEELTEGQKRFMQFWDRLPGYYIQLNEQLDKEGLCYVGSAYRFLSQNIDVLFRERKERVFLFAGFNALSPSEISIIKQLHQLGRAHVIIDADTFYLNDNNHEAGKFLRILQSELGLKSLPHIADDLSTKSTDLSIIECAQHTGQVKVASTILASLNKQDLNETLILLADESLIAPLMKNLPATIEKANITLGLPLRSTALRTWIELIFTIQENKIRYKTQAIYIQDLQRFWNHPFTLLLLSDKEKADIIRIEQELIKCNSIFVKKDRVLTAGNADKSLNYLLQDWNGDWLSAIQTIRALNRELYNSFGKDDEFEKAILETFDREIIDFENLVREGLPDMTLKSFKHLFFQHWNTKSIAYHGNPIDGLQIMGLLETRLLDFKNIIVLGLNEGKMPPTNPLQTMIPMDLRSYLGLPTPREKQGLFAHHFYRLLQRCDTMWTTYTSSQENIGSNEASRYLLQLELELSRLNPNFQLKKEFYSIPNDTGLTESVQQVQKTDEIILRLDEFFNKPISASAINKYINCPLDFYYRYLLEFGEEESIEEEVESNTFGTFIHNVLEELYIPFSRHDKKGQKVIPQPPNILPSDIDLMLQKFETLIRNEFLKHFDDDASAFESGKNLLSFRMAIELTKRILEEERKFLLTQTSPVFIEYIEIEMHAHVNITVNGQPKAIALKGFIDRIDSVNGKIRIIDYKSGKVKAEDVSMSGYDPDTSLMDYFSTTKHAIQLALYTYLYQQNSGQFPESANIYSLVNLKGGLFPLQSTSLDYNEITLLFEAFLQEVVNQLYDKEIPFFHQVKGHRSYCQYCD